MKIIAEKAIQNSSIKKEVKKAVVTVPAYFNTSQKDATADACRIAGLELLRLITEPTAAAVAYGYHKSIGPEDDPKNILVFDLGGGTYDVSCIVASHGVLDVQAVSGDVRLGGRDFDEVLVDLLLTKLRDEEDVDIEQCDETMVALQILCERAKMDLSSASEATVFVDKDLLDGDAEGPVEVNISRAVFEDALESAGYIDRLAKPLDDALTAAEFTKDDIQDVILMGGSTRIPFVKKWLAEYFEIEEA